METSLHRQLKEFYAPPGAQIEVTLGSYRIDVVRGDELIEIQHGSLAAIRDKVADLLKKHRVTVVKPLIVRKRLIKLKKKNGRQIGSRLSPKRGKLLDVFDELVYFTRVFPHKRLTLEVVLVDIEEWRYPGHGRRRRRRDGDFQVQDQKLVEVHETHRYRTAADLAKLLPDELPDVFHTGHVAEGLNVDRWIAQRMAYTLRNVGAIKPAGKAGNAFLYRLPRKRKTRRAA
jgi:hypothetical protein